MLQNSGRQSPNNSLHLTAKLGRTPSFVVILESKACMLGGEFRSGTDFYVGFGGGPSFWVAGLGYGLKFLDVSWGKGFF